MLFLKIAAILIMVALFILIIKFIFLERKFKLFYQYHEIDKMSSEAQKDDFIEESSSRYYAVCVCQKSNKQRSYFSFVTDNQIVGDPSEQDISTLRENVLRANPEFNTCEIVFFGKLKG